uniref:Transposase n=1 Tax=Ascaris lumbricoides TaxID=6252 RepID=A0A0M3IQH3_ASCLU
MRRISNVDMRCAYRIGIIDVTGHIKKGCRKKKRFFRGTAFQCISVRLKDVFAISYFWCISTKMMSRVREQLFHEDGSMVAQPSLVACRRFFLWCMRRIFSLPSTTRRW